MSLIKKVKPKKHFEELFEQFEKETQNISKLLKPAINAFWIYYQPSTFNNIPEIDYKTLHSCLEDAINKIEPLKTQIKDLKHFYYSNYSKLKQEHHDAMNGLNAILIELYKDINSLIDNFKSLEFKFNDNSIEDIVAHLIELKDDYDSLLTYFGIEVLNTDTNSTEKTNDL